MGNAGEVIPDKELSIYIVRGLSNSWETFVQTVTSHDTLSSYNSLWSDCTEEEARLMAKNGETREEDQALAAHWKGKKKKQFHQKNHGDRLNYRNDGRPNNRYEGRSKNRNDRRFDNKFDRRSDGGRQDKRTDAKEIRCFGCEGYGHMKKYCPSVQQNYRSDRRQKERATRVETEGRSPKRSRKTHSTDANYMLLSALSGMIQTSSDTWLIDSGASRHMTGYQKLLSNLEKKESS